MWQQVIRDERRRNDGVIMKALLLATCWRFFGAWAVSSLIIIIHHSLFVIAARESNFMGKGKGKAKAKAKEPRSQIKQEDFCQEDFGSYDCVLFHKYYWMADIGCLLGWTYTTLKSCKKKGSRIFIFRRPNVPPFRLDGDGRRAHSGTGAAGFGLC